MRKQEMVICNYITVQPIPDMKSGSDQAVIGAMKVLKEVPPPHETDAARISYLMEHRHGTPFEHSSITFFVHAPIFVWREWHRHRIGQCLAGDSVVDFLDTNGTRSVQVCRTIQQLHDRWENGEVNGNATNQERLQEALDLVERGVSVRTASMKTGIARGTIVRNREKVDGNKRGSRWRVEGMRCRVLNENTQFFTGGHIKDVYQSGVKELLNVSTGETSLRCSKDHRIYTDEGWVAAGDLRKGDKIAAVGRRSRYAERQIPPSLRRGIGVWTSMQRNRLILPKDRCYICNRRYPREALILDHVIPVAADLLQALDIQNLKPLCLKCNRIKTNGEQKLAKRGCIAGTKFVKLTTTPRPCAEEMTYDIEMEGPHHNFVANGIVVHNSYNEESARYKQLDPVFYMPVRDRPMIKIDKWKAGRPKFMTLDEAYKLKFPECTEKEIWEMGNATYNRLFHNLTNTYKVAYEGYEDNLSMDLDPGLARDGLSVGIYSSCWVTMNPRSLMAFLSLRTYEPTAKYPSYALYEIERAARQIEQVFKENWPLCYASFCQWGRVAP